VLLFFLNIRWYVILTGDDNRPNIFVLTTGINTLMDGLTIYNSAKYNINLENQLNCITFYIYLSFYSLQSFY
jgi:hypothetical protein